MIDRRPVPATELVASCGSLSIEDSYRLCREINRRQGTTYYWATRILEAEKRPHVHALYAFARFADDIVDDLGSASVVERCESLSDLGERFFADVEQGRSEHPLLRAVVATVVQFGIDLAPFRAFLRSMEMDLTRCSYETWSDLVDYMNGSAAAIGEMMLPLLQPSDSVAALYPARNLGLAFQLTNFLRDISEDLERGRQYLRQTDIRRFNVDLEPRRVSAEFIQLMQFEIGRCRELYRAAEPGIDLLPGRNGRCVRTAHRLYSDILIEIERSGYDVFTDRASVPSWRKVVGVGRSFVR
jgi:phytoene synthase